jgi:RNA polymerase sigma-70 factor (ECF subfamily)
MSKGKELTLSPEELHARLSSIESHWTLLFQAHTGNADLRLEAQKQLLLRYYGAVYRYLLGIVHDLQVAEELTQDFAVRFLRGEFHRADPGEGRFRDFLKAALRHLAHDYWRKQGRAPRFLEEDGALGQAATASTADSSFDRQFLDKWREELLSRTWEGLAAVEAGTGHPYLTILQRKTQEPGIRSAQIAEQLSSQLKKPFTEVAVRQLLHRAREMFADLLVEEVVQSIESRELDKLEQELVDLDLLQYCQSALARRKAKENR